MRSLLGDSFLRRFVGDLKQSWKHSTSKVKEQNPEVDADKAIGPASPAVEGDSEKKDIEKQDKLVNIEQNKEDEIKP